MSETTSLVQLQKKRGELENELSSTTQKEAALEKEVKTLEEELAVQLEEKIRAKNTVVERLESTRSDLERRLKELREHPKPSQMLEEALAKEVEPEEEPVEPTEAVDNDEQPQQTDEMKEKHKEDKKRKWL